MKYVRIVDGKAVGAPGTLPSNGSADYLRQFGWLPVTYETLGENQRHGEPVIETESREVPVLDDEGNDTGETRTVTRNVGVTYPAIDIPLSELQASLREQNATKRNALEAAGVAYTFPDDDGTAQTRDARDMLNIQGIVSKAQLLQAQGNTDPVIAFRDAENVTHMMTATQAIEFGETVADTISGLYQTKWAIELDIDALADREAALAFDVDSAWQSAM